MSNFQPHKERRERPHPIGELTTVTPPTVKQRHEAWWQRFKIAPNDYGREALLAGSPPIQPSNDYCEAMQ